MYLPENLNIQIFYYNQMLNMTFLGNQNITINNEIATTMASLYSMNLGLHHGYVS